MVLDRPIPGQTFIAGEFARIWYPGQPKTCRKCGAEGHLAASCKSQRCFNCEQPGHRSDDSPLSPLCRVCLADSHPTPQCPYIYYSSYVLSVKVSASSYLQAAERGKQAEEIKQQQAEEERAERERKEKERERKEKERAEREREERKKQERKERERKEKEKEDRRERERRDHERQEKQDRRERDRKDRHHRRREDQADSGDERRKESKEDRRHDRDYDRSGRDRSSHRYSHASSSESEDDGDRGWIKVTHRKKSRYY